jgi:hypothetical protein
MSNAAYAAYTGDDKGDYSIINAPYTTAGAPRDNTPWGKMGLSFKMPNMFNFNANMAFLPKHDSSKLPGDAANKGDTIGFVMFDVNVGPLMSSMIAPAFDELALGFIGGNLNKANVSGTGTQYMGLYLTAGWNQKAAFTNGPLMAQLMLALYFKPDLYSGYWGGLDAWPTTGTVGQDNSSGIKYSDYMPEFAGRVKVGYKLNDWLTPYVRFDFNFLNTKKKNDSTTYASWIRPEIEFDFTPIANSDIYVGWRLNSYINEVKGDGYSWNGADTTNYFVLGVQTKF